MAKFKTQDTRMVGNKKYQQALALLQKMEVSFYNDRTDKGRSIKLGLFGNTDAAERKLAKLADKVTKSPDYMKASGRLGCPDYKEEGAKRFHFYATKEVK